MSPPAGTTGGEPARHTEIVDVDRPVEAPTGTEAQAFANASNAFGADLYPELATGDQNVVYSPASISMALAMTWAGAHGKTRDEMSKVLHLTGDANELTASAGKLLSVLDAPHDGYTLRVANRLFGEETYPFAPSFVGLTKNEFGAELTKMDFVRSFEPARSDINTWVAKETNDKIQNLLPEGSVTSATRLLLVDAVYLHADWQMPFKKDQTREAPFHAPGGDVKVPTMNAGHTFPFADEDGVSVLDMPYQGGDLSMTLLMPDDAKDLASVEAKLSHDGLSSFIAKEKPREVLVSLPRFTIDMGAPIRLGSLLAQMGMPEAFQEATADLSGMTDVRTRRRDRREPLHISDVVHKAFVAVDERGTEAAAATAVAIAGRGEVQFNQHFTADHPFLFAIRDVKTGLVLFTGRVEKPS